MFGLHFVTYGIFTRKLLTSDELRSGVCGVALYLDCTCMLMFAELEVDSLIENFKFIPVSLELELGKAVLQ